MVWEVKCIPLWIKDENGVPSQPHHLQIAGNVLDPNVVKFFPSNAPASKSLEILLPMAESFAL